MLDQLLVAQASLSTLRVLTNLAIVSAALLAAGGAGLLLTRRGASATTKLLRLVSTMVMGVGALAALTLIVVIGGAAFRRPERFEWTVDLRTERSLQPFRRDGCATWGSGDRQHDECIYEGVTTLRAQFPGDRAVVQTGRALWASGREGRLSSLHHFLAPMPLTDVKATVEPLIDPWRLRRENYDYWLTHAATNERAGYFTPADTDRAEPWLELTIRPIDRPRAGDRLFAVSLKWHWNDE